MNATHGAGVSSEQRRKMIEEAAYFRAQQRGFAGDPMRDWLEAEVEVDRQLSASASALRDRSNSSRPSCAHSTSTCSG
jgi:hypothetical protein